MCVFCISKLYHKDNNNILKDDLKENCVLRQFERYEQYCDGFGYECSLCHQHHHHHHRLCTHTVTLLINQSINQSQANLRINYLS